MNIFKLYLLLFFSSRDFICLTYQKVPFNLLKKHSIVHSKHLQHRQHSKIQIYLKYLNIFTFHLMSPIKWSFSLNFKEDTPITTYYTKKRLSKDIMHRYNRLIYLTNLHHLQQEEVLLMEAEVNDLTSMRDMATLSDMTNRILHLRVKMLHSTHLNYQLEQEIEYLRNYLKSYCNEEYMYNCYGFFLPFTYFNMKKINFYLLRSFSYNKNYHHLRYLQSRNNLLFSTTNYFNRNFTWVAPLVEEVQTQLTIKEELTYGKLRMIKSIYKKYFTIRNTYISLMLHKQLGKCYQDYLLKKQHQLKVMEDYKHINNILKIHKYKMKINHIKKKQLKIQYSMVNSLWNLAVELVPLNFFSHAYTVCK